ncbi:T9SS type A sorting domain-containing protein [Flavobacterium amniphilum]|uniref:T9SS type A sorting domain-containing protein n=1 Tax=Flavobacterium amniphilum TaxID=1834035 RepID=UPI00202ABC88|nr:T9SS type A sorting domain-containing protein [Flavobacterium amniphilum]MCL9807355.1 T9SS type A sorting domain-containing protein [Flavobacterium amniphilum]
MRKIYVMMLVLCGFLVNAQLYVSPGSYMYVNDQHVFVTGNVELNAANSFVYLRNGSQLLQGTAGLGANRGLGNLSVYQEGTVNNYQYNYWCSPVGNVNSSTLVNNAFGVQQLGAPTTATATSAATILPSWNYDGVSGAGTVSISSRWIYAFRNSNAYSQWAYVGNTYGINPGEGFTMKGASGSDVTVPHTGAGQNNPGSKQRYDFRGKPNDGTITNAVSTDNLTLIGNPYPSAIDLNAFLNDPLNSAVIDGRALFWEQVPVNTHVLNQYQGGYGIYTPGTGYTPADFWSYNGDGAYNSDLGVNGAVYQRRFTPVGQGFMVKGKAPGVVTMKNSFRVFVKEGAANFSEFARQGDNKANSENASSQNSEFFPEIPNVAGRDYTTERKGYAPQLRINAMFNRSGVSPTTLAFNDNATDGYDYGFDGLSASGSNPSRFFYILENDTREYTVGAYKFNIDKKIPVGLVCNAQANFMIKAVECLWGFDENQPVYMHDKETDVYYDMREDFFNITLPAGTYKTRFEITFRDNNLSNDDNAFADFRIYQNNTSGMLTIKNPQSVTLNSVALYDVTGKSIFVKNNLGSNLIYEFPTAGLSEGIYIVKLKNQEGKELAKKVSITKK